MRLICFLITGVAACAMALDDAAVREKMKELESPDPKVRAAAVEVLAPLSGDLQMALLRAARDGNVDVLTALRNAEQKRVAELMKKPEFNQNRMAANETAAAAACVAFLQAQLIYQRTDYDKDGVREYAQALGGNGSLLENKEGAGDLELIDKTFAQAEWGAPNAMPKAGYFFKILKRQGASVRSKVPAKNGAQDYVINGSMTGGVALLAFPAAYGVTGRNSFLVSEAGIVYQRDLGDETKVSAEKMVEFDPGTEWMPTE